ncbi:MAG: Endonuclease 8 1 [Pseudomonadota bacterium]|jgi:endonuclease-8
MPEGHTIHRAARDHQRLFAGQRLAVSSPQGRFASGAAQIHGRLCTDIEAYGKHLLYHFKGAPSLHIHLGLFGRIRKGKVPAREPRGEVRIRLVGESHHVDINGPTICETLNDSEVAALLARLGPDPLRDDAEPALAYQRIIRSRMPVGQLLMDQSVIAGIGNIYRTELLWRQRVHPELPGRELSEARFEALWLDACNLLALGAKRNAIITVENAPPARSRYRERVNIFGKTECPDCGSAIRRFTLATRKVYVCEHCQLR